jgi:hypothetical protein
VHNTDSHLQGGTRRPRRKRAPSHGDVAGIGAVLAAKNRDECCLAGTVLSQQCADLAGMNGQVNVVVGEPITEGLRDPFRLEQRHR